MKFISRRVDRFCYNHPSFGISNLMLYISIGTAIVYVLNMMTNNALSNLIAFYPSHIFRGQIWRLVSFVFTPLNQSPLWFLLSTYLYYSLGTTLEQRWGSTKFSVFYGLGMLMTVVYGLVAYFVLGQPHAELANMHYINMSLFLSFATLYPDAKFMIYFIIPVKGKWLAWLDVAYLAYHVVYYFSKGAWFWGVLPIIATLNYLIFFWEDLMDALHRGQARVAHRTSAQTINFKKAQKEVQERRGYLHKCSVCGVTDADNPTAEFRYCSKCNGYYCYCMEHINGHTHIQ